jgi:hypothetical protein
VVVSAELAVDVPTSDCAKDGCVKEEEEESQNIAGIVDSISSPKAKIISLFPILE